MTLPPDVPYLRSVAEEREYAYLLHSFAPEDPDPFRRGVTTCTREEYARRAADDQRERWQKEPLNGAGMDPIRRHVHVLRDLTLPESRFAAARWLESIGRPGWRFLDGPGALTAEQSTKVLHEACIRARDGATVIAGVLGTWRRNDTNVVRQILASHPGDTRKIGTGYSIFDVLSDESARLALVARIDADAAKAGWFCL